jgi:hypothetical protein
MVVPDGGIQRGELIIACIERIAWRVDVCAVLQQEGDDFPVPLRGGYMQRQPTDIEGTGEIGVARQHLCDPVGVVRLDRIEERGDGRWRVLRLR